MEPHSRHYPEGTIVILNPDGSYRIVEPVRVSGGGGGGGCRATGLAAIALVILAMPKRRGRT